MMMNFTLKKIVLFALCVAFVINILYIIKVNTTYSEVEYTKDILNGNCVWTPIKRKE